MARSRVKQDPNEVISCPVCGASFKRKSQYTHRQSEPCLVARDKARLSLLGWSQIRGSELTRFCDIAGVKWENLRTGYRAQGWGKSSEVSRGYFCPVWAATVMHVGFKAGLKQDRVCLALLAFRDDVDAQDGLLASRYADDGIYNGTRYEGALALMSAYVGQYEQAQPCLMDQIRVKFGHEPFARRKG